MKKDVANIPETVPKAKEIRTVSSKTETEIDKPKRRKSNIPIYTPMRNNSTPKGQAGDRDQRRMIAQGLIKKTNDPRHRAEPKGDSRPKSTSRSTTKEAKTMASTVSQKELQTQQKIINRPAMKNMATLERRSASNGSKETLKQGRITSTPSGFHTPTDKEKGRLKSRASSLKEYDDMSSTIKRQSMSVGASSKISGDTTRFKPENKSKFESASTKRRPDNSSVNVHHTKETEGKYSTVELQWLEH